MNATLHNLILGTAIALGLAAPADAEGYSAAVAEFEAVHEDTGRTLAGHVWYPTREDGTPQQLRGSAVWNVESALHGARIAPGVFPVMLISHGMYGNSLNQAWLAQALAREGVISVMPNHPGTTSFDRDPDAARQLWLRATDLSVSLDAASRDPRFGDHMDLTRVAAAGHSLGGYTMLSAAGARHDAAGFAAKCQVVPDRPDCAALAMWRVGEAQADLALLESDRSDPRIATFIALDPGGVQTFDPDSLAAIDRPVMVLGAGRQDMLDQDVEARALAAAMRPDLVTHIEIPGAGHFDFMGECLEQGYAILAREEPGDEIVCEQGTTHRAAMHREILSIIRAHLAGVWH
ncbi:alpha/beta fold hydrolase [uncultured Roseobacter sp.]|uniref:alpha/beta hydrolase family protein n=1 Tax=uncultured Roseobacter sp. TaxID=114847 RepID=UPI00261C9B6C|nr:alpha/beta fold hydrolase [uncultured Roseobacter sp.]